jgi:hypothetical protein
MSKNIFVTILVIILAGFLAAWLFMKSSDEKNNTKTPTPAPTPPAAVTPTPQSESKSVAMARLKAAQDLVAQNPWPDTSKMKDYSMKVAQAAVDASSVDVTMCAPNPSVVNVTKTGSMVFKNRDATAHTLMGGQGFKVQVPPNGEKAVTFSFPDAGIIAYRCDDDFAGILQVVR